MQSETWKTRKDETFGGKSKWPIQDSSRATSSLIHTFLSSPRAIFHSHPQEIWPTTVIILIRIFPRSGCTCCSLKLEERTRLGDSLSFGERMGPIVSTRRNNLNDLLLNWEEYYILAGAAEFTVSMLIKEYKCIHFTYAHKWEGWIPSPWPHFHKWKS